MRCFIASKIKQSVLDEVVKIQNKFKTAGSTTKWVKPENMHFTYHFLPNVSQDKIPVLKDVVSLCKSVEQFKIKLTHIGAFPSLKRPSVLWLGIEDKTSSTTKIHEILKNGLQENGFDVDARSYIAHLTIGRIRSSKNLNILKKEILNLEFSLSEFTIDKVSLIESKLNSCGPLYENLYSINLQ